jgi:hypothetical protein
MGKTFGFTGEKFIRVSRKYNDILIERKDRTNTGAFVASMDSKVILPIIYEKK